MISSSSLFLQIAISAIPFVPQSYQYMCTKWYHLHLPFSKYHLFMPHKVTIFPSAEIGCKNILDFKRHKSRTKRSLLKLGISLNATKGQVDNFWHNFCRCQHFFLQKFFFPLVPTLRRCLKIQEKRELTLLIWSYTLKFQNLSSYSHLIGSKAW